jgi:phage-related protein
MKPVEFLGNSLKALRELPAGGRRSLGFQLERVQRGSEPLDWKPMKSVGSGVCEVRARDESGAYRMMYVAKFEEAVYVLHCFTKKSQKTSALDLDLARTRYQQLVRDRS